MIRSSGDSQVWSGKRSQINGGITADGSGLARAVGRYLVVVIPPPGAAATCGDQAEPSPAARREGGLKRPVASDRYGIPPGIASAGANRHDSPLPATALQAAARQLDGRLPDDRTCHLDRGYDSTVTRELLTRLGFSGQIARKGVPAPVQAGTRWVVERTHAWMNGYGKLRRCAAAPSATPRSSTSTSTSPQRSSRSVSSSSAPAAATDGKPGRQPNGSRDSIAGRSKLVI
jgi:hypothetical protein